MGTLSPLVLGEGRNVVFRRRGTNPEGRDEFGFAPLLGKTTFRPVPKTDEFRVSMKLSLSQTVSEDEPLSNADVGLVYYFVYTLSVLIS
jgi:hypothetical protein